MSSKSSSQVIVDIPKKPKLHISFELWIYGFFAPALMEFILLVIILPLITAFIASFTFQLVFFYSLTSQEKSLYV